MPSYTAGVQDRLHTNTSIHSQQRKHVNIYIWVHKIPIACRADILCGPACVHLMPKVRDQMTALHNICDGHDLALPLAHVCRPGYDVQPTGCIFSMERCEPFSVGQRALDFLV